MNNDCLPCIVRGSLDAARLATSDEMLQQKVAKKVMSKLVGFDMTNPPPLMARVIRQTVEKVTGVRDPYVQIKRQFNDFALGIVPELKQRFSPVSFETAVRLCIAGNVIDFGTHTHIGEEQVKQTIEQCLEMNINGRVDALVHACERARKILWIADNAGEIVFDTLVLEKLPRDRLIYAVRGGPTQNDATLDDVRYTGMDKHFNIIDTGADIPGVILEHCSEAFCRVYQEADLIIAKGQGNLETLDLLDERIFFLFKAKCPITARYAGCSLGDTVIMKGGT